MPDKDGRFSVLFVCLGNICRSPIAEGVFAHLVEERGLSKQFHRIESAGTAGYHIGEEPDERSTAICKKHGIDLSSVCRQLDTKDFKDFDYIVGMDKMNMSNIDRVRPAKSTANVAMFGSFGDGKQIQDPYYGPKNGFETTFQQCVQYSEGLLEAMGFKQ